MIDYFLYEFNFSGRLLLEADEDYLLKATWVKEAETVSLKQKSSNPILIETIQQLKHYELNKITAFELPIKFKGSEFQMSVWKQLMQIPYGQTISYKELAVKVGNNQAARAVGNANNKNPISVIIPCHRVIQTGGKIGGYRGGISNKSNLLKIERVSFEYLQDLTK